jgi:non-ribosomal peptide synthetase component F
VEVEHRGLRNLGEGQIERFGVEEGDRVLQFASLNFDASIFEITMALCAGATICLGSQEEMMPGEGLKRKVREEEITVATLPPVVLTALGAGGLESVKKLIAAGEECSGELVRRWSEGRRMYNAYGPTEMTVCATVSGELEGEEKPRIGKAMQNTEVYIVDEWGEEVGEGIRGEIWIGGVGIGRGYLN